MKRSTDRILVTHVGSLVRPQPIRDIMAARDQGEAYDQTAFQRTLKNEVAGVVRKQADVGIDIVSDGEYGKAGWIRYVPSVSAVSIIAHRAAAIVTSTRFTLSAKRRNFRNSTPRIMRYSTMTGCRPGNRRRR